MSCSDLTVIITEYESVITLVNQILAQLNAIGTNTGNTEINNFVSGATAIFTQAHGTLTDHLQPFKDAQTQKGCNATTQSSSTQSEGPKSSKSATSTWGTTTSTFSNPSSSYATTTSESASSVSADETTTKARVSSIFILFYHLIDYQRFTCNSQRKLKAD